MDLIRFLMRFTYRNLFSLFTLTTVLNQSFVYYFGLFIKCSTHTSHHLCNDLITHTYKMYHDYLHILDDRIKYPTFQGMLILNSSSSRSLMLVNLDVQLQNFIDIPLWANFIIHLVIQH